MEIIPLELIQQRKEYLQGYLDAKRDCRSIEIMIKNLQEDEESITGIDYRNGMTPKAHDPRDLSDYAAELDEMERELKDARRQAIKIRNDVYRTILKQRDSREKEVLTRKYINGESWKEIAKNMSFTGDSRPRELCRKALENLRWPD